MPPRPRIGAGAKRKAEEQGGGGQAGTPRGPKTPAKGLKQPLELQYEQEPPRRPAGPLAPRPVALQCPRAPAQVPVAGDQLCFMALDIIDEGQGCFHVWGVTSAGASVLLRLHGLCPYFYIAAPRKQEGEAPDAEFQWDQGTLKQLQASLNRFTPPSGRIEGIEALHAKPLMYYRPDQPDGGTFLKLQLAPGGNAKTAGEGVARAMSALHGEGWLWRDRDLYESEIKPLQRLLVDCPLSGGAWLHVPPAAGGSPPTEGWSMVPEGQRVSSCALEAVAPWQAVHCLSPDASQLADPGWDPLAPVSRGLGADGEAAAAAAAEGQPSSAQAGTAPHAQQGQQGHQAQQAAADPVVQAAAEAARRGDVAPLRTAVMEVCTATADGVDRTAVPSKGDPVVAIACTLFTFSARGHQGETAQPSGPAEAAAGAAVGSTAGGAAAAAAAQQGAASSSRDASPDLSGDGLGGADGGEEEEAEQEAVLTAAAVAGGPTAAGGRRGRTQAPAGAAERETVVFLLHTAAAHERQQAEERSCGPAGASARVLLFASEAELLLTWAHFLREADPDAIGLFQVNDTLAVLTQRFEALGLSTPADAIIGSTGSSASGSGGSSGGSAGRGLRLSRLLPRSGKPMGIQKVTNYSAQWAKDKQRLSAGSNQETWRVTDIDGRLVVDVVRQAIAAQSQLASYSFADCVQTLLGETLEVLRPCRLAALAGIAGPPQQPLHRQLLPPAAAAEADAMRLARYALRRCDAVCSLLHRLATVPDTVEMARACGLTLKQAMYNGAMQRVHSLLLRAARRRGFLMPVQTQKSDLKETTFIQHPVECGTVGLYKEPVAILDFASLYPSIYRAYNLCYSTLLHDPQDAARLPPDVITVSQRTVEDARTGQKGWGQGPAFVKPEVRRGVLPDVLTALVTARAATRELLRGATDPATRAVLDCRQRALKITANAVYGFTGTNVSPLQSVEVGDACLAFGRRGCETAKQVLEAAGAEGRLGQQGAGAAVLYGHTDSLFCRLPHAPNASAAIRVAREAAKVVSSAFPDPVEIKFERVCQPFLLLHVNRYAGRAFEREEEADAGQGELICKGMRSMWRQSAPILRTTLHGALVRILMRDDLRGAVDFVAAEVRRLLSGRVELSELVMTGGLWRVTGEQVERAAAGGKRGAEAEDIRQPHNALAVRLRQRDPGFSTVLGQRLPYVLLAGKGKQDESSEDPLTAAKAGEVGDYQLYWKNKMKTPILEVFEAAVPPGQRAAVLHELSGGDHTRIKVDALSPPPPALGPASPQPGSSRGGLGAPPTPGKRSGMAAFFKQVPKCLGCKANLSGYSGPLDDAPGLCDTCAGTEGRMAETYLSLLEEQRGAEARQSAAFAACRDCHSGGACEPVLCENGECPVTYTRLSCSSRLQLVDRQLRRLDISF